MARRFAGVSHDLKAMVSPYADGIEALIDLGETVYNDTTRKAIVGKVAGLTGLGAPKALAQKIARVTALHQATDIIDLAGEKKAALDKTATLYFLAGERFGFEALAEGAALLASSDDWDRMATRRLTEDVRAEQKMAVRAMMASGGEAAKTVATWEGEHKAVLEPLQAMITDMRQGGWSFAKLTIANAILREWAGKL
jgi:glutamate dehydrogenase